MSYGPNCGGRLAVRSGTPGCRPFFPSVCGVQARCGDERIYADEREWMSVTRYTRTQTHAHKGHSNAIEISFGINKEYES